MKYLIVIIGIVLILIWYFCHGVSISGLRTSSSIFSYEQSVIHISEIQSKEKGKINPLCASRLFTHGKKVKKTIILLHGFTNCPQQFETLGKQLYELGYNVYIPLYPYHGLQNRMNTELKNLSAEKIKQFTDEVTNTTYGLGESVSVMGLSAGGLMAGWIGQYKPNIQQVMIIAPNFQYIDVPMKYSMPVTRLLCLMPFYYKWWDDNLKETIPGPKHAYPGFPLNSMGEYFYFASILQEETKNIHPKTSRFIMVNNADDKAVHREQIRYYVNNLKKWNVNLTEFEFPSGTIPNHDIIDPAQPNQPIEYIYPQLIKLLEG